MGLLRDDMSGLDLTLSIRSGFTIASDYRKMRCGTASFCLLTAMRVKDPSIHGNFLRFTILPADFTGPKFQNTILHLIDVRGGTFNEVAYGGMSFCHVQECKR